MRKPKKSIFGKRQRSRKRRHMIGLLVVILSFLIPWSFAKCGILGIGEESIVGIFGVCASVIGAILVVFELHDNERVVCCSMLSDMNMKFIENERMMLLYQELCKCVQEPGKVLQIDNSNPEAIHSADLMAYMTFYEVINEYVKNGVLSIKQMDDLFGDRFFKLIHNDYVQEYELYAEPSSYVNIFQLYEMWKHYRSMKSPDDENRFVVLNENAIPDLYMEKKLYLHETMQFFMSRDHIPFTNSKGKTVELSMHRLLPRHLSMILNLQASIVEALPDKSVFAPSTKEEILESMLIDFCYGLFDKEKLVAVCICVLNRKTALTGDHERNLCIHTQDAKQYIDYVTFDSIQVHPQYRGYGIQKFFLHKAEEVAAKVKAKYLIATVSPDNQFSKRQFEAAQYQIENGKVYTLYNGKRLLMKKQLAQEKVSV